ncbi:DUF420 domain-containing protein [Nocardia higoensis]|uniref:DUF420 domain-containing protein n=1 Tax=Nocardia higoensis TaxID=228599 RepID=A0ABS0D548_9NOCA|nr:DUF420 domain-containing protein [Nocardia higoensis]MBF6353607.1 DUF420 domain-containing protein [Nocardia higoensis]
MNEFPGVDGFLGTRASWSMDTMVLVMAVVVAVLAWSVYQAKAKRKFVMHKRIQILLAMGLFAAVVLFEIDVRFNGWQDRAAGVVDGTASAAVWTALAIHLAFAVFSVALWPVVIIRAARNFGATPHPGAHSAWHRRWAPIAAIGMTLTAVTSWVFYGLAFVA